LHGGLHAGALQQHVLVDARQVGHAPVARERLGNAADLFAFGIVLVAIGKRGQKGDGEDGFLLVQGHGVGVGKEGSARRAAVSGSVAV